MTTRSPTEREIFLQAIEVASPKGRAAVLDEACGGNTRLRAEVESLLAAHDRLGELSLAVDESKPTEHPGTRIGPYTLVEKIGEGGFGLVFVADQSAPVRRTVALKVIKPGMDTAQVVARFEAERQALALMDHPNIAKVFDAGVTETGRPYFVMELVRGASITEHCDCNRLSPNERLALFMNVCDAVQHAHQKGIIHRDLKPSNVLVTTRDGTPVVKVIDFGVAKAIGHQLTERTFHTNVAQLVGTPLYMSPEQAELSGLDIDTRSDIYSLGVLLYELFTGSTPFDRKRFAEAPYDEVRRIIREEEPATPSTRLSLSDETLATVAACRKTEPARLSKLLRGDLDWITMKCLEKDRTRRYQTASALAADIQNYLSGEPVTAGPPGTAYRLRKFVKRNRGAVTAVSFVLMTLLIGIAGTTWGFVREARKAEGERLARQEAQSVIKFMEDNVFAAARPELDEGGLGHDVKLRDAMKAALPKVAEGFADNPLTEARLRMTLGKTFSSLGDPATAEMQFSRARDLYAATLGADHPTTLQSMSELAHSFSDLGRQSEALALYEKTLNARQAILGHDHPETLSSMGAVSECYADLGRYDESLALFDKTLKMQQAKCGRDHPDTLGTMHNLAICYSTLGRHTEAMELREETVRLRKAKLGSHHRDTLGSMQNLANSYAALGRHADALRLAEETLNLQKVKLGPSHPATLMSMNNVAIGYAVLGRHADALALREETLKLLLAKYGPDHSDTLRIKSGIANSYAALGRHAEAQTLREETLKLKKAKLGLDHPDTLIEMHNLGNSYATLGRHAEALAQREETLQLQKAKFGLDHPETIRMNAKVADSLLALDRMDDALTLIDDNLRRAAGKPGVHPQVVPDLFEMRLRIFAKRGDSASCRATAEMWEWLNRSDVPGYFNAACNRAVCAAVMRDKAEAGADEQADQAMTWLRRAIAAGFDDAQFMKKEKKLDALRNREDFQTLMRELEEKAK